MNDFTKENRRIPSDKINKIYKDNIVWLDSIIARIQKDNHISMNTIKDLCLFFANYSSGTKTVITRYLQKSGITNQNINNFSVAEMFVKFKKEIAKDTEMPCSLNTELHLVSFDLRNKLAHNLNQINYMKTVVEQSGIKKITSFLCRISDEAKEIEHCFNLKLENSIGKDSINENKKNIKEQVSYPFGLRY